MTAGQRSQDEEYRRIAEHSESRPACLKNQRLQIVVGLYSLQSVLVRCRCQSNNRSGVVYLKSAVICHAERVAVVARVWSQRQHCKADGAYHWAVTSGEGCASGVALMLGMKSGRDISAAAGTGPYLALRPTPVAFLQVTNRICSLCAPGSAARIGQSSIILMDQYLLCCMLSASLTTALSTMMRLLAVSTHARHDCSINVGSLPQNTLQKPSVAWSDLSWLWGLGRLTREASRKGWPSGDRPRQPRRTPRMIAA